MNELYLEHHGILGQKWGIRRYQNKDGSVTPAGAKRYYGKGSITKDGKYRASNGTVIAKSRSGYIDAMRRFSVTPAGRVLSAAGRGSMSKVTGRSKESIKAQETREREALKEYYKNGGDKMFNVETTKEKKGLNDKQKTAIKVGAGVAVAAIGGYALYKSGALNSLKNIGAASTKTAMNKVATTPINKIDVHNTHLDSADELFKQLGVDLKNKNHEQAANKFKEVFGDIDIPKNSINKPDTHAELIKKADDMIEKVSSYNKEFDRIDKLNTSNAAKVQSWERLYEKTFDKPVSVNNEDLSKRLANMDKILEKSNMATKSVSELSDFNNDLLARNAELLKRIR